MIYAGYSSSWLEQSPYLNLTSGFKCKRVSLTYTGGQGGWEETDFNVEWVSYDFKARTF